MHSHFLLGNVLERKALNTKNLPLGKISYHMLAVPGSGGEAGRSVGEGFAGAQRGGSEAAHTLPQPGRGVPLLKYFYRAVLEITYCQQVSHHSECLQLPEALLPSGPPGGRTFGQPPGLRSLEAEALQTWIAPWTQLSSSPSACA